MSGKRIAAIILILLLLACFAAMVTALALGRNDLFFILGGVLVGILLLGFVLKKIAKPEAPEEERKKD